MSLPTALDSFLIKKTGIQDLETPNGPQNTQNPQNVNKFVQAETKESKAPLSASKPPPPIVCVPLPLPLAQDAKVIEQPDAKAIEKPKKRGHNTPKKGTMEDLIEYMLDDDTGLTIRFWKTIPSKKHPEPCDEKHVQMDDINVIVRLLLDKLRVYNHVEFKPSGDEDRGQTWQYRDDGAKVWHCKMASEKSWTTEACGPPDITNVLRKLAGQEPDPNYPPVLNL